VAQLREAVEKKAWNVDKPLYISGTEWGKGGNKSSSHFLSRIHSAEIQALFGIYPAAKRLIQRRFTGLSTENGLR
jgi:hypothetical protein